MGHRTPVDLGTLFPYHCPDLGDCSEMEQKEKLLSLASPNILINDHICDFITNINKLSQWAQREK